MESDSACFSRGTSSQPQVAVCVFYNMSEQDSLLDGIQPLTGVRPKETHKRSDKGSKKDELDDDFMPDENIKSRTAPIPGVIDRHIINELANKNDIQEAIYLRDLVIEGHKIGLYENMEKVLHDLPDLECKEKDLPDLESPPDGRPPVEGHQTPPHLVYKVGSFDSPIYPDTPGTSTIRPSSDSPCW